MEPFIFDKTRLSNLEESLQREFVCVSSDGTYAGSSIVACNTRKYHGLFVCAQPDLGQDNFVLLSSVEETVLQRDREFHLGVKQYQYGVFEPKGHKYLERFEYLTHPVWIYHVGGVVLRKELLMHPSENRLFLKYTLEEAHSDTTLRIRPFLAFRNAHELTICNNAADTRAESVEKGVRCRMYPGFSDLYMQTSSDCRIELGPDWYRNIEYAQEQRRGYPCLEDQFTPCDFEIDLKVGKPVYFCAGLSPLKKSDKPEAMFKQGVAELIPQDSMENCLKAAASTFLVRREKRLQVMAGYPWFGSWGRDTFISLPGLTLCTGREDDCAEVLRSMIKDQVGGLFPNVGYGGQAAYNSVDAPLWFVWAVQQYAYHTGNIAEVWKEFGPAVKQVIECFEKGDTLNFGIGLTESGLVYAGRPGYALTWMDAVVNGKPVTPREGLNVEINALWYNAVMFALEAERAEVENEAKIGAKTAAMTGAKAGLKTAAMTGAKAGEKTAVKAGAKTVAMMGAKTGAKTGAKAAAKTAGAKKKTPFVSKWEERMKIFPAVFKQAFWDKEKGYLADTINFNVRDWTVRPNQIIAVSLPYSPVSEKVGQLICDKVKNFLLTPRGLRTLAPSDNRYKGVYEGDQAQRDQAYHQGTAWTWLLGHFAEAYIKSYGENGRAFVARLYEKFEPGLREKCLGTIAEIYDGDPGYAAKGAVSQAWSVAELLRIKKMIG